MADCSKTSVIHVITSLEKGGAQEVLQALCSVGVSDYRHTVFYMTGANSYRDSKGSLAFARTLNIVGLVSLLRAIYYLSSFLRGVHSPICIQGWMYHGNLLALLVKLVCPRLPLVFSIHNGSDNWEFTSVSGFIASRFCGLLSGLTKSTIFVSENSLKHHSFYKNSIVIPNPIKRLDVADGVRGRTSNLFAPVVTLACVARFDRVKNIGFLLDVIQALGARNFRAWLLMAGEGMSSKNGELMLMLRARGLEADVELLGVVSDVSSVYSRADYTILTSKCESFSNVLLESIACGTPFISSSVGIAEDLVSPESTVIHGYDPSDWVERLQKILQIRKTPMISQSVKQHYEKISETYAPGRIAQLYANCWTEAIGR